MYLKSIPIIAAIGLALALPGAAAAQSKGGQGKLPENLAACGTLPDNTESHDCVCEAGFATGSVWGAGPYTADSSICTAALHAGVIGADGGAVTVLRKPGQASYDGSESNGVTTRSWGSYDASFDVRSSSGTTTAETGGVDGSGTEVAAAADLPACATLPDGVDDYACECGRGLARGSVWGAGPYTSDSDICTAARHAGVIRAFGGEVRVLRIQGLDRYAGGSGNGVTTSARDDAYDSSIVFDMN